MRKLLIITGAAVMFSLTAMQTDAQLINYDRKAKRTQQSAATDGASAEKAVQEKTTAIRDSWREPVREMSQTSFPEVSSRTERVYDIDRDGFLQPNEVNEFLKSIVSMVERSGNVQFDSDILSQFDKNKDNQISRYEARDIKKGLK